MPGLCPHWYSTTCFGVRAIGVPIARQARALISYAHECVRKCVRTGARPPKDCHLFFYLVRAPSYPSRAWRAHLRTHDWGRRSPGHDQARTFSPNPQERSTQFAEYPKFGRYAYNRYGSLHNNLDGPSKRNGCSFTLVSRSAIPSYRSTIVATAVRAILVVLAKAVWIEPRRTRWGVRLWWKAEGCRENGTGVVSHYSEVFGNLGSIDDRWRSM